MKKKLSVILLLIILVGALLACVACKTKTEPVYQGMTIARQNNTYAVVESAAQLYANNGNGVGWGWGNEGKKPDNGEFVPADGDDEMDKDVEDIITIEVEGDDTVKYYVKPNETFIVQIHISNPDDYEIQSFTLNGQKYANYMFRQGSTMELLLLEVQAPSTSGYLDLTIDAIKYIDGTEIKDVRMDGSKTIKAGIAYQHEPTATVTSQKIDTTKATFTFNVSDTQAIIGNNAITAYLTDGENKIAEKALKVGSNAVTFDNLTMGKTYQYGIATSYDLIDGYGVKARWLLSDSFSTLKAFAITNGVATQDSVSFNVEKTGTVGNVTSVKLYDYDSGDEAAKLSGTVAYKGFDNLLSNHSYLIEVNFDYEVNKQTVSDSTAMLFTTLAKTAPTVEVTNATSTQTAIGFEVVTTDVDNILTVDKIELYRGETLVKTATSVDVCEFTDLLSNNEYTIKVTYSYDLNDGNGVHTQTATANKKTLAKTAPTVNVTNSTSTQTSISFDVVTTDVDNILTVDKIELYRGETLVKTATSVDVREFTDLLSNNEYTIKVTYSYDLNDGNGVHTQTATAGKTTVAKTTPTVVIENTTSTQTTLGFGIATTDVDGILNVTAIELYNGETVAKTLDNTLTTFVVSELTSGTMYTIKVTYTYDLNDGEGVHTEYATTNYPTLVESVAVTEVSLVNSNQVRLGEELNLRVYFDNPNNVQLTNIYVNGQKVQVSGGDRRTYAIVRFATTESGLIDFYVDRVDYNFAGVEVNQHVDSLAHVTFPVFTDLDVKFEGVSASPYEYTGGGIYFYFDNPQDYKVYKVNDRTDFTQISDHEFYITLNEHYGHKLTSIEYGYDNYGTTTQALNMLPYNKEFSVYSYGFDSFLPIYTTDDFLNMSGQNYYILMNDLDMRNVNVAQQIALTGYLNGNGHTIRGLHNVIDTSSQNYFDLFTNARNGCSIFDVNFTELYLSIVNSKTDKLSISLFGNVRLYNCTVSGDFNASGNYDYSCWNGYFLIEPYNDSNTFNLNTTINNVDVSEATTKTGVKIESNKAVEITDDGVIYYHCGDNASILLGCYNKNIAQLTIRDDTIRICESAFYNCSSLTSVTIPNSVTTIGDEAFLRCSSLTSVTIPDSVISIEGHQAFYGCGGLENVVIGNGVTSLNGFNFSGNTNLKSIVIGNSVTSIGSSAFFNCSSLTSVYYTGDIAGWCGISGLDNIMSSSRKLYINNEELTGELVIPDTVTEIKSCAFFCCTSITSVVIPDSVTTIGENAFFGCVSLNSVYYAGDIAGWCNISFDYAANPLYYAHNLYIDNKPVTELVIPDTVTKINSYAFEGCTSITSVTIGNSVTSIGYNAFRNCSSLTSVTIPDSVTTIGDWAFHDCSRLTSVTIGNSVTSICEYAFYACNNLTSVYYTGDIAGWCNISFDYAANPLYYAHNLYIDNKPVTELVIPDTVTEIKAYAFVYCTSITSVTIGDSVKTIGAESFENCNNLKIVTIPDSVTTMSDCAFSGCSLTSVYYKGTADDWAKLNLVENMDNYNLINATRYYYSVDEPALNADGTAYDGNYWYYNDSHEIVVWTYNKEND